MRRLLGLVMVAGLMVPALAAMGTDPVYHSYKDQFDKVNYSGTNGSLPWKTSWVEFGDENPGPEEGNVHVGSEGCAGGKCLHLEGQLLDLDSYGAYRAADLSVFETVELCFEMNVEVASEALFYVYVSPNGSDWRAVKEISLLEPIEHPIIDLSDFRTEGFKVKFKVDGLTGLEVVTIDNVELKGTVAASTTTSSTSTTSTSTTSTSTTSTTIEPTTTTSTSTTSTTSERATSTTNSIGDSTDTTRPEAAAASSSTTTTSTTSTTAPTTTSPGTGAGVPPRPPFDSGLRVTAGGLMVDYPTGMMGDMEMGKVEVLGAEVTADFSLSVEVIETGGVWVAVLALFITAALVSGMDRRRSRQGVI